MTTPAQYAQLAANVEANLPLSGNWADWKAVLRIFGRNALFGAQRIGLGEEAPYGYLLRNRNSPLEWVAVIRGTSAPIEWLEDLRGFFIKGPPVGLVHAGFWPIYQSMWMEGSEKPLAQAIAAFLPNGADITVVGHSLGSALGTYLMADLARPPFAARERTYSVGGALFASPRPGDAAFAADVDAVVGHHNYTVYNFLRDVIPRVPISLPFGLGFSPLSNVHVLFPADCPVQIQDNLACSHHCTTYVALLGGEVDPSNPCIIRSTPV